MGYYTDFTISIKATTPARKAEIFKTLIKLAGVEHTSDGAAVTRRFEQYSICHFDATWYHWDRDVQGDWFDGKRIVKGLQLNEGENLNIEGFGEHDDDIWKSFVSKRKFSIEHCLRVEFAAKGPCEDDETEPVKCTGCQGCATRVPIYE